MKNEEIIGAVERAAFELKSGRAVEITGAGKNLVVVSAEYHVKLPPQCTDLLITSKRADILTGGNSRKGAVRIKLDKVIKQKLADIIALTLKKIDNKIMSLIKISHKSSVKTELAALELAKIAEVLPAVLVTNQKPVIKISAEAVQKYSEKVAQSLEAICQAPLTLENANSAEMAVFRARGGTKEHYAIIIGKPGNNPLVRVHSACFTGDVLASLRCDCRDQLQESISAMSREGGGILIYLLQDGRGIGLVNKLRTYTLQADSYDTVDANEFLGFEDDERPFLAAATILKKLGFKKVRLLTNNPRKVKGLEDCGVKVSERVGHLITAHEHNKAYMETKFSKLGHLK